MVSFRIRASAADSAFVKATAVDRHANASGQTSDVLSATADSMDEMTINVPHLKVAEECSVVAMNCPAVYVPLQLLLFDVGAETDHVQIERSTPLLKWVFSLCVQRLHGLVHVPNFGDDGGHVGPRNQDDK
jgi:hypothetical protein